MPIAEEFAGALDLEILLGMLGGLVVEEPVGVLLPRQDLELQAESMGTYVGALEFVFISNL